VIDGATGLLTSSVVTLTVTPDRAPRTFTSPREAWRDLAGVARRAAPLGRVYLRGGLDPELRERVMVAVSRVNSCRGCSQVHERWAIRTGVSSDELDSIGLGEIAALDERSRAAVLYATAGAEARFREPIPTEVAANAAEQLTSSELIAVDAVARAMTLANLSLSTTEALVTRALPSRARNRIA
jgi:AhpD family alkylhydroperoxidase